MSFSLKKCLSAEALQFKTSTVIAGFPEGPEVNRMLGFWSLRGEGEILLPLKLVEALLITALC